MEDKGDHFEKSCVECKEHYWTCKDTDDLREGESAKDHKEVACTFCNKNIISVLRQTLANLLVMSFMVKKSVNHQMMVDTMMVGAMMMDTMMAVKVVEIKNCFKEGY